MRYDAVVIGGGASGCAEALERVRRGEKVCLVAAGLTLHSLEPAFEGKPYKDLRAISGEGVAVLRGDIVNAAVWAEEGKKRVLAVRTANGITLEADSFVLATGRFFSRGLMADMDRAFEPVFGADVEFPADRSEWFDPDFFAPQPFESIGVRTDSKGRITINGKTVENVYAVGKILGGKANAGK